MIDILKMIVPEPEMLYHIGYGQIVPFLEARTGKPFNYSEKRKA